MLRRSRSFMLEPLILILHVCQHSGFHGRCRKSTCARSLRWRQVQSWEVTGNFACSATRDAGDWNVTQQQPMAAPTAVQCDSGWPVALCCDVDSDCTDLLHCGAFVSRSSLPHSGVCMDLVQYNASVSQSSSPFAPGAWLDAFAGGARSSLQLEPAAEAGRPYVERLPGHGPRGPQSAVRRCPKTPWRLRAPGHPGDPLRNGCPNLPPTTGQRDDEIDDIGSVAPDTIAASIWSSPNTEISACL